MRCEALAAWDSSLLVFLMQLVREAQARGLEIRRELPHGLERLVQLAFAVPAKQGASRTVRRQGFVAAVGASVAAIEQAAGVAAGGEVPALATKEYVAQQIAALDDLSGVEF